MVEGGVAVSVAAVPAVGLRFVEGYQLYDEAPEAVIVVELPSQIVDEVGVTVMVGVVLITTVTVCVPLEPQLPPELATTEYVPAAAAVTLVIVGFSEVEVNALGPVHAQTDPPLPPANKSRVFPVQTGLLLVGAAVTLPAEIVIASVPAAAVPQELAACTEIVPLVLPMVTVMVGVPWPAVMVHPVGTDHS